MWTLWDHRPPSFNKEAATGFNVHMVCVKSYKPWRNPAERAAMCGRETARQKGYHELRDAAIRVTSTCKILGTW